MQNLLNSVQLRKPSLNVFDLSEDHKLSLDMGWLIPTYCRATIPGDRFTIGCDSLIRFAPLIAPVMHRMDVSIHYFFVPNRIVWPGFEDYMTAYGTGASVPSHPFFQINPGAGTWTSLCDYFGIPKPSIVPGAATTEHINALPFAAYQAIWNEYFRDQNLQPEVDYTLVNGSNNAANIHMLSKRRRAWEHDYFTSALPFAQKGNPVSIPISGFEDVPVLRSSPINSGIFEEWDSEVGGVPHKTMALNSNNPSPVPDEALYAQTSSMSSQAATINDLRRAFRLQEWVEKQARGGSRYTELILNHFGVKSSDARLQRPEYITGVKSPVIVSEVLNTSGSFDPANPSDPSSPPQGNMAGHAVSVQQGKYGKYFCEEHGFIIGVMSVMPKTSYMQGIQKEFKKINDPFEYYWPSFAHIGEQEVINSEIYAYQANGNATFGYLPRYTEYKVGFNRVSGEFADSLDFWHLGRKFASQPGLNSQFIECVPTTDIFAVAGPSDHLYCHMLHKIRAVRPMPKFGTPTF